MSDPTEPKEPITGHDQTNGLADGLEGDDDGVADPSPEGNVIGDAIRDLDDPLTDEESGETPYSEEGKA
jgi:hypothetical protein